MCKSAKEEVATAIGQLREAELEARALRSMTQRMILTQEEMVCTLIIGCLLDIFPVCLLICLESHTICVL